VEVLAHRIGGRLDIVLLQRGPDPPVLRDRDVAPPRVGDGEVSPAIHLGFRDVDGPPQHREIVDARDIAVELVVKPDGLRVALAPDRRLMQLDDVFQRLGMGVRHLRCRPAHAFKLQRGADDIGFLKRLARDFRYKCAGLRIDVNQALVAQTLHRLANRRARYAEPFCDLDLVDRLARPQLTDDHQRPDDLIDLIPKRQLPIELNGLQLICDRFDHFSLTLVLRPPPQESSAPAAALHINPKSPTLAGMLSYLNSRTFRKTDFLIFHTLVVGGRTADL